MTIGVRNGLNYQGTFAADGTSASFQWIGGTGTWWVFGTFGGGTVLVQTSPDLGATWDTDYTLTSGSKGNFGLGNGVYFRFVLSGATAPAITYQIWDCQPLSQTGI